MKNLARSLALLMVVVVAAEATASPLNFSVGAKEVIYKSSKRKSKGGKAWPDGNIGIVPLGNGMYDFYAANGTKPSRTTGTLTDPGSKKKKVKIVNVPKKTFNYVSGGPVFQDPNNGTRFMIYHAEKHGSSAKDYYSVLGLAICRDPKGLTFTDLGTIIEPDVPINQAAHSIDIGGGSFAIFDDQLHVYYRDYLAEGGSAQLAVARAPLADILSNSYSGRRTNFSKYYNGAWDEPGIGGKASGLEIGNPSNAWSAVSYNDYLDQLVMVSSQWTAAKNDLYMATSADGINWSPRQALDVGAGEQFYPSIIGTGADPTRSDQSFYVYYTDSKKGAWSRWSDAQLVRREVTFNPAIASPPPPPPGPMDWVTVGDYLDEFQTGGPAAGWQYAWNSNGKQGATAAFTPLIWSESTQAYNTTGGALTVPTNVIHNDDYLHLTADGGHPGHPKYMPVVGYTIQEEDGAGYYRIADSSVQKLDGVLSSREDGLGVLVYLNSTLLGTASVGTNGLLANFDRELGELNVGDTIRVMVDPLTNLYYDSFVNLDFSIQKGLPLDALAGGAMMALATVPEPSTFTLLMMASLIGALAARRR